MFEIDERKNRLSGNMLTGVKFIALCDSHPLVFHSLYQYRTYLLLLCGVIVKE